MTRRRPLSDADIALAKKLLESIAQQDPANDSDLTEEDERELQERADRAAERMRQARKR